MGCRFRLQHGSGDVLRLSTTPVPIHHNPDLHIDHGLRYAHTNSLQSSCGVRSSLPHHLRNILGNAHHSVLVHYEPRWASSKSCRFSMADWLWQYWRDYCNILIPEERCPELLPYGLQHLLGIHLLECGKLCLVLRGLYHPEQTQRHHSRCWHQRVREDRAWGSEPGLSLYAMREQRKPFASVLGRDEVVLSIG